MIGLLRNPMLWVGVALRLSLSVWGDSQPAAEWYVPFLRQAMTWNTLDPWFSWLSISGEPIAFPYGLAMFLAFLPLTGVSAALGIGEVWGYFATLFVADCVIFGLLLRRLPNRVNLVLATYWLSPILLYATYWLGRNDVVPVALLMVMLLMIRSGWWVGAGLILIVAISAKMSMIVVVPFVVIYFLHNPIVRRDISRFVVGATFGLLLLFGPVMASEAAWQMLLANPETGKLLALGLASPQGLKVYLVPLVYVLMLYATWRIRRFNYPLLELTLGLSFLILIVLTPASPGWYVWVVPFLVIYQASSDSMSRLLVALFGGLFVLSGVVLGDGTGISPTAFLDLAQLFSLGPEGVLDSLLYTGLLGVGMILGLRAWREGVQRNDFLRLSRRPFLIGIAGDSGSGKDTLSQALTALFGRHSVTSVSGDDYHLWDRQRPIWQAVTHLNPSANDLERYVRDVHELMDRKPIHSRHYDHDTGRMSQLVLLKANDFIIASGLHALYFQAIRELCSVSIYLNMDEDLRRHLKVRRDVLERGHSEAEVRNSLHRREQDAKKFVHPQQRHADLVFSVRPQNRECVGEELPDHPLRLLLVVQSNEGLSPRLLTRALVGVCGLHVDARSLEASSGTEFTIEGDCSAEDVALAALIACPRVSEFLDVEAHWKDGVLGIMQLLTLMQVEHSMSRSYAG